MSLIHYFCKKNIMKKEQYITTTHTGGSTNHYNNVSFTLHAMEDMSIVWVYRDNVEDLLLEGSDVVNTRTYSKCFYEIGSETNDHSRIVRQVSTNDNVYQFQSKNISNNSRNKIYRILKWFLKMLQLIIKIICFCRSILPDIQG